jgi:dienelactone hydrolase
MNTRHTPIRLYRSGSLQSRNNSAVRCVDMLVSGKSFVTINKGNLLIISSYCFGAPYVCNSLATSTDGQLPVCEVGAFAHPAFLKEHHLRHIERPLFLSCSEIDHTFDTESRRRALDILSADGKQYNLQLFSGVQHGFALRGDMSKPYERWVKEQSLASITTWFDYWLDVPRKDN